MCEKVQLKKSATALLCVDLQKCYYTHPATQYFPNLEKVNLSNPTAVMRSKGREQPARALQGGQGSYRSRHAGGLAPCKPIFRHASVSSTYPEYSYWSIRYYGMEA